MNKQTYKFTDDGRKVIVIAPLNAKETIVQEIFVSAGQEVPSGENFVVKNLHDAPAESWKDKDLKKREEYYLRRAAELESFTKAAEEKYEKSAREMTAFLKERMHWRKNMNIEALDTLFKFLNDQVTHIAKVGYCYEILPFKGALLGNDMKDSDLKLISLFGSSEGNLDWKLNYYRDGSGCYDTIIPCCSIEEAHQEVIKAIQKRAEKEVTQYMLDAEKKYGIIALSDEQRQSYRLKEIESRKKRIDELKKNIAEEENKIQEYLKTIPF